MKHAEGKENLKRAEIPVGCLKKALCAHRKSTSQNHRSYSVCILEISEKRLLIALQESWEKVNQQKNEIRKSVQ